jgi:hypothetical protein
MKRLNGTGIAPANMEPRLVICNERYRDGIWEVELSSTWSCSIQTPFVSLLGSLHIKVVNIEYSSLFEDLVKLVQQNMNRRLNIPRDR